MADRNDNVHEADESLPDELAGRLEQLYRPLVFVPPEVDERIMDEAGRRLAPVRRRQWRGRVASAWGSMAAVLLAAVTLWWFGEFSSPRGAGVAGDIDGSGRVDIVDALRLAGQIEQRSAAAEWDIDGDGDVNAADVDVIAYMAVSIAEPAGESVIEERGSRL